MTDDAQAAAARLPDIRVPAAATFAGLIAGLALGLAVAGRPALAPLLDAARPVGALWLRALQMTILPLVAGLLFTGIVQTVAAAQGGALARRALALFVAVLAGGAVLSALAMPALLALLPVPAGGGLATGGASAGAGAAGQTLPGAGDVLLSVLPANIVAAAAGDAMLPLVAFVALFALASTRLDAAPRRQLALLFEGLAGAMMVVVGWVLALAPVGVFALALGTAAQGGVAALGALAHYVALACAIGALVLAGAYPLAVLGAGQPLAGFARAALPAQAVAVSTQSSLASLPAMLAASRRLGVADGTAELVLPLAVSLFRATSPAMNIAVALYAAHLGGVTPGPGALAAGVAVAVLVSLTTVSLPGTISFVASVGPVALAMGAPVALLALLVAVEMLPDILRTLGNVTMDLAVTATVDRRARPPE